MTENAFRKKAGTFELMIRFAWYDVFIYYYAAYIIGLVFDFRDRL